MLIENDKNESIQSTHLTIICAVLNAKGMLHGIAVFLKCQSPKRVERVNLF